MAMIHDAQEALESSRLLANKHTLLSRRTMAILEETKARSHQRKSSPITNALNTSASALILYGSSTNIKPKQDQQLPGDMEGDGTRVPGQTRQCIAH